MGSRRFLHGDGTGHGIDNRAKLYDCAIAHQLDDAASVVGDQRVQYSERRVLIEASVRASSASIMRE